MSEILLHDRMNDTGRITDVSQNPRQSSGGQCGIPARHGGEETLLADDGRETSTHFVPPSLQLCVPCRSWLRVNAAEFSSVDTNANDLLNMTRTHQLIPI